MTPKIERLTESFSLGEGPHWDPLTQSLYFVDCIGQQLVRYNPATNKIIKTSTAPKYTSFIIPVEGKQDHFIISLNKELAVIFWDGESDQFSVVEKLCVADDSPETVNSNFSDVKCDSSGRLWAGTLYFNKDDPIKRLPKGTLYSFDSKHHLKGHVSNLTISNGMAFNEKNKKMFYIDTAKNSVDRFDFDIVNGTICNREVWCTLESPDGMTIDSDGNLWVAMVGHGQVVKIDGNKPETLLETIKLPAVQVTSVTFGGANLDELYVTTACFEINGHKPPAPVNGAVFRITGIESKGLAASNFKFN